MKVILGIIAFSFAFLFFASWIIPESHRTTLGAPMQRNFSLRSTPMRIQQTHSWSLLLTGDIIPARAVNAEMVEKNDFYWPIRGIADTLKSASVTLSNLESPLIAECPSVREGFKFCTDFRFAQSLYQAGIDVVNLANNHSLNYGWDGIAQTEQYLQTFDIQSIGYASGNNTFGDFNTCRQSTTCSTFTVKQIENITVGFLGYNGVGQELNEAILQSEIQRADTLVDVLVVSMHWGKEYERFPKADVSLAPDDPTEWGKKIVNWGADVVVGNHPHWYQNMAWHTGKDGMKRPVFYALGNTVFDQEWSQETKRGILVRLTFMGDALAKEGIEIIPIGIRDYGEAYLLEDNEKQEILDFYRPFLTSSM